MMHQFKVLACPFLREECSSLNPFIEGPEGVHSFTWLLGMRMGFGGQHASLEIEQDARLIRSVCRGETALAVKGALHSPTAAILARIVLVALDGGEYTGWHEGEGLRTLILLRLHCSHPLRDFLCDLRVAMLAHRTNPAAVE